MRCGLILFGFVLASATALATGAHAAPAAVPPPPPPDEKSKPAPRPDAPPAAVRPAYQGLPRPAPVPPAPSAPAAKGSETKVSDPFAVPTADMSPSTDLSRSWSYTKGAPPPTTGFVEVRRPEVVTANPIGFYSGVAIGVSHTPPRAPKSVPVGEAVLTWTGFQMAPSVTKVFFQVKGDLKHELTREGSTIRLRFSATRVTVRNNLRPLDLRFFDTPVKRVDVRRDGRDLVAEVELKSAVEPTVHPLPPSDDGYRMLVLEFPR